MSAPALPDLPTPYTAQIMCGEDTSLYTAEQMRVYARAALAAPPSQEPAAYQMRRKTGGEWMQCAAYSEETAQELDRFEFRPLYAAPIGAQPVAQEVADWAKTGVANFIADNWADRKYTLAEIEAGVNGIEIRYPIGAQK